MDKERINFYVMAGLCFVALGLAMYQTLENEKLYDITEYKSDINSTYYWNDYNKTLDANFLLICYEFMNTREYVSGVYDCKNYSTDFMNLMNIYHYPVNTVRICDPKDSKKCHRLNWIYDSDKITKIIVEPQTCKIYSSIEEAIKQQYGDD